MPINREDGRHYCAPDQEQPDEAGQWTCPDCGQQWLFGIVDGLGTWEMPEDRERRIKNEEDTKAAIEEMQREIAKGEV